MAECVCDGEGDEDSDCVTLAQAAEILAQSGADEDYQRKFSIPTGSKCISYVNIIQQSQQQCTDAYADNQKQADTCMHGLQDAFDQIYNSAITRYNNDNADAQNQYGIDVANCNTNG